MGKCKKLTTNQIPKWNQLDPWLQDYSRARPLSVTVPSVLAAFTTSRERFMTCMVEFQKDLR